MRAGNDNAPVPESWAIDGDGWFIRAMREGDIEIDDEAGFGFTCEGMIFVADPQACRDYDRGVVPAAREVV